MNGYTDLYTSSVPDTTSMNTMNARVPTLHRQQSRQFDVYGTMPQAQNGFYDSNRGFGNNMNNMANNQNYDLSSAQTWNHNISPFGGNGLNSMGPIGGSGATTRMRSSRGRAGLPNDWLQTEPPPMPGFPPMDNGRMGGGLSQRTGSGASQTDLDDELIPTAIVIKNIPFAVRKEQLMQLMSDMSLPLPYAFNYHFDNGVFRGLAFANFTSPDETAAVIEHLNMYELQGRKLRVEYKKMLPLEQRERIEREKRQRRGQLEEQHRPIQNNSQLHSFPSMSSVGSHPPPSTSPNPPHMPTLPPKVDMNDPINFKWYQEMITFKYNHEMETHIFEPGLLPAQRRVIHTMAHHLSLNHFSTGEGDKRQVHITRLSPARMSPPNPGNGLPHIAGDAARGRVLNRAATTEGFNENRHLDAASYNNTLRGQTSLNLMPVQDIFGSTSNLRAAKSYADLRSYTPSPVYSTTSLSNGPSGLGLQQMGGANNQNTQTPLLTPAASHQTLGSQRDENMMVNGFGGLSLGTSIAANSGSPRRLRNMFSWDQEHQQQNPATAPIGSNRTLGSNVDGRTQPMRQPAIPATDRGTGFRRPNGHQSRGSDEYRSTSTPEIIVE